MVQQLVTPDGIFTIPGSYPSFTVQKSNSGLATTGVLFLVGEADQGPDWTLEADLSNVAFGPTEVSLARAKFGSGNLVDAMNAAATPSSDPAITGAPNLIYLIKSNPSLKASGSLLRSGFANYGTLADRSFGAGGNLIYANVTAAQNEVAPTTGATAYIPGPNLGSSDTYTLALRVNGGAKQTLSITHQETATTLVGAITTGSATGLNSLNNILATGGQDRTTLASVGAASTLAIAVSGNVITLALGGASAWTTTPSVGDTLVIPAHATYGATTDSRLVGAGNVNLGSYVVTAATANTITATKLKDATAVTITPPIAVTAKTIGISLAYNTQSGNFTVGQVVTGGSSGATGTIAEDQDNGSTGVLRLTSVTGTFTVSETITDPITGSATAGATTVPVDFLCYAPIQIQDVSGEARNALTALVGQTLSGAVSGQTVVVTLQTGAQWAALPQAGDLAFIPSTAPAAISANGGWYSVTAATTGASAGASTITMTRLSNGAPTLWSATAIAATTDLQVFRPAIDGIGKALEIYDGGGALNVSSLFYTTGGAPVAWLSTASAPVVLKSGAEYEASVNDFKQSAAVSESNVVGGTVALDLGYAGTTATMTLTATTLTTSVTGGNGSNLSLQLSGFKTLGDLANYLNSQTGYTCSLDTVLVGQQPVQNSVTVGSTTTVYGVLDQGTYGIGSELGAKPGRVKTDAFEYFTTILTGSALVQPGSSLTQPASGLPEVQGTFYLAGGARGGTTAAAAQAAIDACAKIKGNFLVPLFSQDATLDIAAGLTDPSSTYTIDAINAAAKAHVLLMSQIKRRRNRQAFVSKRTTFTGAKQASQNLASFRVAMTFQDFKELSSQGAIVQFQPWAGAVLAAAMQAAGGYRALVHKLVNTSGVVMADGSFNATDDDQVTSALENGLLVVQPADGGGFQFVSDQTTYGIDNNQVFNSVQAVYDADTVALTTAVRMEKAFVGQDLASVSASVALAYFSGIMADLKRLKLITASDDAPAGFKNVVIKIQGPAMFVSAEIKLNTALYFIPIAFTISQVTQTAST